MTTLKHCADREKVTARAIASGIIVLPTAHQSPLLAITVTAISVIPELRQYSLILQSFNFKDEHMMEFSMSARDMNGATGT